MAFLFAVGSGLMLVASSAFLSIKLNHALDRTITSELAARADDIDGRLQGGIAELRRTESFAQVLGANGDILAASSTIRPGTRLLNQVELAAASRRRVVIERPVTGIGDDARLLALPATLGPQRVVIVVAASLVELNKTRERLTNGLLITGPLLIAALAGAAWLLTGAALHPVRRMADEAQAINPTDTRRRLAEVSGDDEIAHLSQTLNAMLDRVEQSFLHERAFVDDASHELRTPLSILRAELEIALRQRQGPAELEQTVQSALEEVDRLCRLADDLLVLARAGAGTLVVRRDNVDLHDLANGVASRANKTPGPAVVARGDDVVVKGDAVRIEAVLFNLVDNARRFAQGHVDVSVARENGHAVVTVHDDGPGFDPAFLPIAFDRFSRAAAARGRATGGAGLGLAIVAAVVNAHDGVVIASNAPDGGGVVSARLPLD